MRVLVTRPEADAAPLIAALEERGHETLAQPLLSIEPVEPPPILDLSGVQALLFTSANGVRTLARLTEIRDRPVFAVGDASAAQARDEGFVSVKSASGAVEDLAALVIDQLNPDGGPLLHGAGDSLAGDLKGALEAAGFAVRRVVLYKALAASGFSPNVQKSLAEARIGAVLLFSPRSAETFVGLAKAAGLESAFQSCYGLCLSAAVAERIAVLPWRAVEIAKRPDQASLLESLESLI